MATQIDLGVVVPIGKGNWDIATTYERTNIVRHNSAAWVCKVNTSIGVEPSEDSSDWYLLTKDTSSVTSVNGQKGDVTINIETVKTPEENDVSNKIVNTEWVNNKITPIKSELSSTTSIADDAKNTAILANSTANTALTNANNALSDLDNYLPLTGGTLTGSIKFNVENDYIGSISGQTYGLLIDTYESGDKGAFMQLYKGSSEGTSGDFIIGARNSDDSKRIILVGTPDGLLYWGNKHLVRSVNGTNADSTGNVTLNLPYLPLAGGTMTGTYPTIKKGDVNSGIIIQGGTNMDNGASLYLYGKGREGGGWFQIITRDVNGNGASFVGRPGGTLTWNGKHIVRSINNVNADANGNVSLNIAGVKVNNAAHAGSASSSYICTGVAVWNSVTSATLPNYGTWAWFSVGGRGGDKAGTSAGGTRIYYDNHQESYACIIAIRIG